MMFNFKSIKKHILTMFNYNNTRISRFKGFPTAFYCVNDAERQKAFSRNP